MKSGTVLNKTFLVSIALAAVTAVFLAPVCTNAFVNYDDYSYITDNPHIREGLTAAGLKWAFSAGLFFHPGENLDYWQPVTNLSRMLDLEIFGLNPVGHHLSNLMLHAFNVLLFFLILKFTTGAFWRSAFAAAAFGLHPVQVEAVAWVTARKDVLGMFFALLTVLAYIRFVRKPGLSNSLIVIAVYGMTLMSKAMFVTLPFLLFLLDVWPLARVRGTGPATPRLWAALVLEKAPLFMLALFSGIVTFRVQPHTLLHSPAAVQIADAVVFYFWYLGKWIFPRGFAIWYPYPGIDPANPAFSPWLIAGAAVMLAGLCMLAYFWRDKNPWFGTGWLWYAASLLPVIGLRPADRFLYLPAIGLAILSAWGGYELLRPLKSKKRWIAAAAAVLLGTWGVLSFIQTRYWKDTEALFRHAVTVTRNNYKMHYDLGFILHKAGRNEEALIQYREAVKSNPYFAELRNNLGVLLYNMGRNEESLAHFREAFRLDPYNAKAAKNMANALFRKGETAEAKKMLAAADRLLRDPSLAAKFNFGQRYSVMMYTKARLLADSKDPGRALPYFENILKHNPHFIIMYMEYGALLERLGRTEEALRQYVEATRKDPDYLEAHLKAADLFSISGAFAGAALHYSEALRLDPANPVVLHALGNSLARLDDHQKAIALYSESVRLDPLDARVHYNLGNSLSALERYEEAAGHYGTALRLDPEYTDAYLNLANCYARLGKFQEAAGMYDQALARRPADAKIYYNKGISLEALRQTEGARKCFAEALRLQPDYADARAKLAESPRN